MCQQSPWVAKSWGRSIVGSCIHNLKSAGVNKQEQEYQGAKRRHLLRRQDGAMGRQNSLARDLQTWIWRNEKEANRGKADVYPSATPPTMGMLVIELPQASGQPWVSLAASLISSLCPVDQQQGLLLCWSHYNNHTPWLFSPSTQFPQKPIPPGKLGEMGRVLDRLYTLKIFLSFFSCLSSLSSN